MKLLHTSDFHGDLGHYERLVAAAEKVKPDLVVLGGDMLADDSALEPETMGHGQPDWVRGPFRNAILKLREAIGDREILTIFGNHDWYSSIDAMNDLASEGLLTVLESDRVHQVLGLNFVGYSCSPPTPWFVKDFERLDMPGDTLPLLGGARWNAQFSRAGTHDAPFLFNDKPTMSEELAKLVIPPQPWVFVAHSPPHGTKLDRSRHNDAWGSRAIKSTIEKHKPFLSLHGHIHDSPGTTGTCHETIGQTVAVNPGQSQWTLHYAVITIDVDARQVTQIEHGKLR